MEPTSFSLVPALSLLRDITQHREAVHRADLEFRLGQEALRIRRELELERIEAQKEIALAVLQAAQHVFDRKMDFMMQSARLVHEHAMVCQRALEEHLRECRNGMMKPGITSTQMGILRRQCSAAERDLLDLAHVQAKTMLLMNAQVSMLDLNPGSPQGGGFGAALPPGDAG